MGSVKRIEVDAELAALSVAMFEDLLEGKAKTAKELAKLHNISLTKTAQIIASSGFIHEYNKLKQAVANLEFDASASDRGNEIIRTGTEKNAVAAIKVMADLLGRTQKHQFNQQINVNLEGYKQSLPDEKELAKIVEVKYPGFSED